MTMKSEDRAMVIVWTVLIVAVAIVVVVGMLTHNI